MIRVNCWTDTINIQTKTRRNKEEEMPAATEWARRSRGEINCLLDRIWLLITSATWRHLFEYLNVHLNILFTKWRFCILELQNDMWYLDSSMCDHICI